MWGISGLSEKSVMYRVGPCMHCVPMWHPLDTWTFQSCLSKSSMTWLCVSYQSVNMVQWLSILTSLIYLISACELEHIPTCTCPCSPFYRVSYRSKRSLPLPKMLAYCVFFFYLDNFTIWRCSFFSFVFAS